jgi:hypothetical protein
VKRLSIWIAVAFAAIAAVLVADAPMANAAPGTAPAAVVRPSTIRVTCNSNYHFFELYTKYHGYPVCYAQAGDVYYGNNPPVTTWTTYSFCSGNNSGFITYFLPGVPGEQVLGFAKNVCHDFVYWEGSVVEVEGFHIY